MTTVVFYNANLLRLRECGCFHKRELLYRRHAGSSTVHVLVRLREHVGNGPCLAVALADRLDWVTSLCSSYIPFLRARSYRGATPVSAISSTFGSVFFLSFFLSCVFLFDKTVDTAFKYLEHMSYVFKAVLLNIYFKCPLVQGYFYFKKNTWNTRLGCSMLHCWRDGCTINSAHEF